MKVYEYGEQCPHDGILWSNLVISNDQSLEAVKAGLIAKLELDTSLTAEALDDGNDDDADYITALTEQKERDLSRLDLVRGAKFLSHLCRIDKIFVRQRDVAEYAGCDYWSLLAAKEVSKTTNA